MLQSNKANGAGQVGSNCFRLQFMYRLASPGEQVLVQEHLCELHVLMKGQWQHRSVQASCVLLFVMLTVVAMGG